MKKEVENILIKSFSNIVNEKEYDCVHLTGKVEINDILEFVFHMEKVKVEKDDSLKIYSLEKNRFTNVPVCFKCNEPGHISRDCPNITNNRCCYCDLEHLGEVCPLYFCHNCGMVGHQDNKCRNSVYKRKCVECFSKNFKETENTILHEKRECFRNWRKYTIIKKPTKEIIKTCFNCPGENTHAFGDCPLTNDNTSIFSEHWLKRCKLRYEDDSSSATYRNMDEATKMSINNVKQNKNKFYNNKR